MTARIAIRAVIVCLCVAGSAVFGTGMVLAAVGRDKGWWAVGIGLLILTAGWVIASTADSWGAGRRH